MIPLNPLLVLASTVLPGILDILSGDRADKVTQAAVQAVTAVTGSNDPQAAEASIAANPALAATLRLQLAQIVAQEKAAILAAEAQRRRDEAQAEAQARKDALDRDIAEHKAKLEETVLAQKAAQDQAERDQANTDKARGMLSALIDKDAFIARTPMVLSYMVTVGFFAVLAMFVILKGRLEAPTPAQIPSETVGTLASLKPEQIAALVSPRSDFVIQIINICVGALSAAFATVMSFWLGSSQSSRNKDVVVASMQERNAESQERQARDTVKIIEQAQATRAQPSPAAAGDGGGRMPVQPEPEANRTGGPSLPSTTDPAPEPTKPASAGLFVEVLPELMQQHRQFPDSSAWALTATGISIDGARAQGTVGQPSTVRRIWTDFGTVCAASAKKYGVPVELIVATIATESSGDPTARRAEPAIGDESVGLMQTLVKTARFATGKTGLSGSDLLDPAVSIDAGTAYIASQRGSTHFDPPRVAAAYNAGSIKRDDADANRWKMHCFPRGTGQHIDRFVAWFGDAMRVSDADDWGKSQLCPSFAQALAGLAPSATALDKSSPDFPPRPAFRPIVSDDERRALFGTFQFVHEPVPDNPENIRILGNWESRNIVTVSIPLKSFLGRNGPLKMHFHAVAKDQLIALWLAWEKAGLLDRIQSFDGAFVPRFQRKSTSKLSNHAFGSAFDINAATNPLGAEPAAMGTKGCVRELVPLANAHGFYWGGHFSTRPDGMHFEVAKLI